MKQEMNNIEIVRKIAKDIKDEQGKMYFVGGYVRDQIMGKESKDIDAEVFGITEDKLLDIISKYGKVELIGKSFGVYKLYEYDIDISLPRNEKTIGVKHQDLDVTISPYILEIEACKRRDFTMNALLKDVITGEVIDYFNGISDIKNKVIRHIDKKTFAEDKLRVLRACQFASRFNFNIADETISLCQSLDCKDLSKERIYAELEKVLMKSDKPSIFFNYARKMDILSNIFTPLDKIIGVKQEYKWHPEGDVWNHTMMVLDEAAKLRNRSNYPIAFMLSAICHDLGKITNTRYLNGRIISHGHENQLHLTKEFLANITQNKDLIGSVLILVKNHMRPNILAKNNSSNKAIRKLISDTSGKLVNIKDVILLSKADRMGRSSNDLATYDIDIWWQEKLKKVNENKTIIEPLLTGKDLIKLGYNEGTEIGRLLKFAFNLQIEGLSKEEILNKIKKD